ncbi:MAG TPA: hypothetical protein VK172_14850 [Lentimicrobium sp.]|nr:hypothetical protein [Bacteroidales bacterium]HLO92441.1 hypothetical protein [Lentimicrobium sp.]
MDSIKWDVSRKDSELIVRISDRAEDTLEIKDGVNLMMDITAVHRNDVELDLQKLLDAPEADFAHDIYGIQRHIDRSTGKLTQCFLPRCSKPQKEAAV